MTPYFEANGITLYHGDCREVLPTLGPVDHVITDPPYSEETHAGARTRGGLVHPAKKPAIGGWGISGEGGNVLVDFEPITVDGVRAIFTTCAPRRWLVATMDWRHIGPLDDCPPRGLRFVRHGAWIKPGSAPQFTGDRPATGWESVAIFHPQGRMRWNGGGNPAVWVHPVVRGGHPTEKPVALLRDFVVQFTDPGETILDPFAGSGTTLVAAYQLGRKSIGVELEEKWSETTAKRLEREMAQGRFDLAIPETVQEEVLL